MPKKAVFIPLVILNLAAIGFGLYAGFYTLFSSDADVPLMVGALLSMIAMCSSLMYVFYGYKKNVSSYFRGFMFTYALSQLAGIVIASGSSDGTGLGALLVGAIYGPLLVLALASDLGKKKSLILCAVVVVLQLGVFVGAVITTPGLIRGGTPLGTLYMMRAHMQFTLAVSMTLMTVAKYTDKAIRGTK